jgi:hypothetical protein
LSKSVNGLPAGSLRSSSLRNSSIAATGEARGVTITNALAPCRAKWSR